MAEVPVTVVFPALLRYNMAMKNDALKTEDSVTITRSEYENLLTLKSANAYLESANRWLEEQLKVLKDKIYGAKSEKASEEVNGQMCLLFDEPEVYAFLEEFQKGKINVAEHQRTLKERRFILDDLPEGAEVEVEEHRLSEGERICPNCGNLMTELGKEVERTVEMVPAKIVVHEDWYFTYGCKECETDPETDSRTQIIKTPHVPSVYPGSNASASAVAYLMTQKYVMGTPLYRMELDFSRNGYSLSRQTMSNWMIHCSEKWLAPIYEELHRRLLKEPVIHVDETTVQVINEKDRKAESKSYMWVYCSGKHSEHPIRLYEYQPGRSGKYPAEFLKGFSGYLQTDGYGGYDLVPDVIHVGCMAHLKRKFHEAVIALPAGKKTGAAVEGEAYCDALFKLEESFENLSNEERKQKRQELSKPILDEFFAWGSTRNAAAKSKLGIALTYLHNNTKELSEYLNDGRLDISNNLAERSIKPFVIDRKNFLFCNTPKGAVSSAVTFSIIETAKASGLNPFKYLAYVFKTAPILEKNGEDWVTQLLPEIAPAECRGA